MKIEIIDGYKVYKEDGEFKKIVFEDYSGKEICINFVDEKLKDELIKRRRENYAEQYRTKRYVDTYLVDSSLLEIRISSKTNSVEEKILENDKTEKIIQEIWKLPSPQNRRVFMRVVNDFTFEKIAKIEKRDVAAIKRSVDAGMRKLKNKLKNF